MATNNNAEKTDKVSAEKQAQKQSQIKVLIARGKEKAFLTYAEVADHLPEIVDTEQIEDIISMIQAMGIPVHEEAPQEDEQLFAEPAVVATNEEEEDAAEEAAAAIAALDDQFGRTTDPVRMYMREMGSVELLDREGEIRIAKRIEEGLNEAMFAMAQYPETVAILLESFENYKPRKRKKRPTTRRTPKKRKRWIPVPIRCSRPRNSMTCRSFTTRPGTRC
jgi:RNA polymerase primary sigma factor